MGAILNLALGCLLILQEWDLFHGFARIAPWGQGLILALGPLFVWGEARREPRPPRGRPVTFQIFALLSVLLACLALLHNAASKRFERTWPVTSESRLLESSQKIRRDFQAFLSELREPLRRWRADDCLGTRETCFEKLDTLARSRGSERDRYGWTLWQEGEPVAWSGRATPLAEGVPSDLVDGFQIRERGAAQVLLFAVRIKPEIYLQGEYLLQSPFEDGYQLPLASLREALGEERVSLKAWHAPGPGEDNSFPFRYGSEDYYWAQPRERRSNLLFPLRDSSGRILAVVNLHDISVDSVLRSLGRRVELLGLILSVLALCLSAFLLTRRSGIQSLRTGMLHSAIASVELWTTRFLLLPLPSLLPGAELLRRDRFACVLAGGLFQSPGDLLLTSLTLGVQAWWWVRLLELPDLAPLVRKRLGISALLPLGALAYMLLLLAREIPFDARFDLLRLDLSPPDSAILSVQAGLFILFGAWLLMTRASLRAALRRPQRSEPSRFPRLPGVARLYAFVCLTLLLYLPVLAFFSSRQRERFFESDLLPQLEKQHAHRRVLLERVLDQLRSAQARQYLLRSGTDHPDEGLAYRLWGLTELKEGGVSSALRVVATDGRLISRFGLNLWPSLEAAISAEGSEEEERIRALPGRLWRTRQRVLVGDIRVSTHPGERVAIEVYVLDEFENLPFTRAENIYVELFQRSRAMYTNPELVGSEPLVAVFESDGVPIYSNREGGPALPQWATRRLASGQSRWTSLSFQEDRYRSLIKRSPDRIIALGFLLPSTLEWMGGYVRMTLLGFLIALALWILPRFLTEERPMAAPRRVRFFQRLLASFMAASLIPLFCLGFFSHRFVAREIQEEIASEGLASLGAARRVIEDYYRSGEAADAPIGDDVVYWLSRVVRQDISLYTESRLAATSTRELYVSGLLSTRLAAGVYRDLLLRRRPYSLNTERLAGVEYLTIAASIPLGEGTSGILSLPLALKKREILEKRAEVDEAILIVTVTMLLLLTVLAHHMARRIAEPISALAEASRRIEGGDYDAEVRVPARDEAAQLIDSFNRMAASLRRQREDLRRRSDYIEKILLNATTGVISTDPAGRVVTINPAARQLLRLSDANPEGKHLLSLLESLEGLGSLRAVLATSRSDREATWHLSLSPGGDPVTLRAVSLPFREAPGSEAGRILLLEDLTETVRSSRLEAWADMARRIAHEIKNPLTPIQLSADHLRRVWRTADARFDQVLDQCLDTIQNQVRALRAIAADFSDYARIPRLRPERVSADVLLGEALAPYRAAPPPGVRLESGVEAGTPALFVDKVATQRALLNLIANALEAMEEGGVLRITAERAADGGKKRPARVRIRVRDTGPGMDAETRARLFEPYFSTKSSGTGLGLSIVRKTTEEQGGRVEVLSTQGGGTEVVLDLPAASDPALPSENGGRTQGERSDAGI